MKKPTKLLALVLALTMVLSLGGTALAFGEPGDWSAYQQYVYSFAEAGAPTPEDAASMAAVINACSTMDELRAAPELGVFFAVLGALDYDAWAAAGRPAAGTSAAGGSSQEASGETSAEPASEEPAASEETGSASGEAGSGASGEASGEAAPAYGDLTEPAGPNAVLSYHENAVTFVSDGVLTTLPRGRASPPTSRRAA